MLSNDEMSVAGRELAAMQHELRAALWRNARLAALGTVVAKVSHDLRGILTPALLTAERLQLNTDPKVQRAGETWCRRWIGRPTWCAARWTMRGRDHRRWHLAPVELAPLSNEAAETARPVGSTSSWINASIRSCSCRPIATSCSGSWSTCCAMRSRPGRGLCAWRRSTTGLVLDRDRRRRSRPARGSARPPVPSLRRQRPARRHRARPGDRPRSNGGARRRHRAGRTPVPAAPRSA